MNNAENPQRRSLLMGLSLLTLMAGVPGCSSMIAAKPSPDGSPLVISKETSEQYWADTLKQFVDDQGRVNFEGLAANTAALQKLSQVVRYIEYVSPERRPDLYPTPQSVLAFHINAYNTLAMYAVIEEGIPQALKGYRFFKFFFANKVVIGGKKMSLYTYENDVIRPLGDPRIHFAVNCMSIGCPRLPTVPFNPATLDSQLDNEARRFFAEERNVRLNPQAQVVELSEILKFYTEDFLRVSTSLISYANRFRTEPIPVGYEVRFQKYDWTVNRWQ